MYIVNMKTLYTILGVFIIIASITLYYKPTYTPAESNLRYHLYVLGQETCKKYNLDFNCQIYTFPDTPEFKGSPDLQGSYLDNEIALSQRLLTSHQSHIDKVFLHEVAHYINDKLYGGNQHDSTFKIINQRIGGYK